MNRHSTDRKSRYRSIRSVFETPILDDYKWAKVPDIPAGMMFLDLEDLVASARKEEARERAVHYLRDPSAPDYRDLPEIRRRAEVSRMQGCTALSTFYPPHVQIIHDIFTPTEAEVAAAREPVEIYGPEVRLRMVACATSAPPEGEATWTHTLIAQQLPDVGISPPTSGGSSPRPT